MIYAAFLFLSYNVDLIQTTPNGYKKGYIKNLYFNVTFFLLDALLHRIYKG
ncbi:hypothetical protein SAMN05428988_1176 [Chitinophaga sp. YR573]|nr:hypothetical protein SAMN05428988_1176 [Chitinophaga sp. YR573]